MLTVDYTQDLEGELCKLTLSYDASVIISPNSTIAFDAISRTAPLIISTNIAFFDQFKVIFTALSYVALALFCLSLPHKLIGAELLVCCQIVYVSHCFYGRASFLMTSLKSFNLVTGLSTFFYADADRELLFPFTDRVEITAVFLKSCLFIVVALLLFALLWGILAAYDCYSTQVE